MEFAWKTEKKILTQDSQCPVRFSDQVSHE
jgi:hypothetical protein